MSTDGSSFCSVSHVLFYVFILAWDAVEALQDPGCGLIAYLQLSKKFYCAHQEY